VKSLQPGYSKYGTRIEPMTYRMQNILSMKIANVWSATSVMLRKKETPKYLGDNLGRIPRTLCFFRVLRHSRNFQYTGDQVFPGVKQPGRGVDHPSSSSAEAKERVELYLYSPSGLSWPVLG
jgi:hypothetical protein